MIYAANPAFIFVYLAILVFEVVVGWRIFTKADQPGWAVIIPIYNVIVFLRIIGRPWWWLLLYIVFPIGIPLYVISVLDLARSFGRSMWYGVWMVAGVFVPFLSLVLLAIISFGSSEYRGPAGHEPWDMAEPGYTGGEAVQGV